MNLIGWRVKYHALEAAEVFHLIQLLITIVDNDSRISFPTYRVYNQGTLESSQSMHLIRSAVIRDANL